MQVDHDSLLVFLKRSSLFLIGFNLDLNGEYRAGRKKKSETNLKPCIQTALRTSVDSRNLRISNEGILQQDVLFLSNNSRRREIRNPAILYNSNILHACLSIYLFLHLKLSTSKSKCKCKSKSKSISAGR